MSRVRIASQKLIVLTPSYWRSFASFPMDLLLSVCVSIRPSVKTSLRLNKFNNNFLIHRLKSLGIWKQLNGAFIQGMQEKNKNYSFTWALWTLLIISDVSQKKVFYLWTLQMWWLFQNSFVINNTINKLPIITVKIYTHVNSDIKYEVIEWLLSSLDPLMLIA